MNSIERIVLGSRIIADDVKVCKSVLERTKGLMFSRRLRKNQALVLVNSEESVNQASLHMFFVFFSIDIAWLNKNFKIVDVRQNVKPFTPLIIPGKAAKYIIEFPAGKIKHDGLMVGDELRFL